MPFADTEAMQAHLAEISDAVAPDAHAVLVLDQAGWHVSGRLAVPHNILLLPLPPRSEAACERTRQRGQRRDDETPQGNNTRPRPYPERDPAEQATRLIEGSPSHPVGIDHFLFRG